MPVFFFTQSKIKKGHIMARRKTTPVSTSGSVQSAESDFRLSMFNLLQTTPHRDVKAGQEFHTKLLAQDPIYYGKLADWYIENGAVRDHKELFIANLFGSSIPEHREAAFMYLQELPAHLVSRTVDHIINVVKLGCGFQKKTKGWYLPRQADTAVTTYLRRLEHNDASFDWNAVKNRKVLRNMYTALHKKPSFRANQILFKNDPPEGSLPYLVKQIAKEDDPNIQAELLVRYNVPYTTAVGIIKNITPAMLVALVNNMSPQELANNIKSLEKHGAYNSPEIKKLVQDKLQKKGSKVAAMKVKLAVSDTLDTDVAKSLDNAATKAIRSRGTIDGNTLLLVDASGSMRAAIESGKRIASAISTICTGNFYCYAFDNAATEVVADGTSLDAWEKAFQYIRDGGNTSVGCGLYAALRKRVRLDKIVIITDEGENASPYFHNVYDSYVKEMGVAPNVTIVRIGRSDQVTKTLRSNKVDVEVFTWEGDYNSIPNLMMMIARKSQLDLILEIMDRELPKRPKNLEEYVRGVSPSKLTDATV